MLSSRFLAGLALAVATCGSAAEQVHRFRGYAYERAGDRLLYTEIHEQRLDGERWLGGTIDYVAADGTPLGRKMLTFADDPYIPLYRLELRHAGGYREGIDGQSIDRIDLFVQTDGAREPRRASIRRRAGMAADTGFHALLRDRFARLLDGERITFELIVPGSLETFRFRARQVAQFEHEGQVAVRIRVEPDSLLRWLVPHLELTYTTRERRLLEYQGLSNVHDPRTGRPYNVRTVYPPASVAPSP